MAKKDRKGKMGLVYSREVLDFFPKTTRPLFEAEGGFSLLGLPVADISKQDTEKTLPSPDISLMLYEHTGNPVWIWLYLAKLDENEIPPPEVVSYLCAAAEQISRSFLNNLILMTSIRIEDKGDSDITIRDIGVRALPKIDLEEVFGFKKRGQNLLQTAAKQYRDVRLFLFYQSLRDLGYNYLQSYEKISTLFGKSSADGELSIKSVQRMVRRGKKIILNGHGVSVPGS